MTGQAKKYTLEIDEVFEQSWLDLMAGFDRDSMKEALCLAMELALKALEVKKNGHKLLVADHKGNILEEFHLPSTAWKTFAMTIDETFDRNLCEVMKGFNKKSRAETLRFCVALLMVAANAKEAGHKLTVSSQDDKVLREIVFS